MKPKFNTQISLPKVATQCNAQNQGNTQTTTYRHFIRKVSILVALLTILFSPFSFSSIQSSAAQRIDIAQEKSNSQEIVSADTTVILFPVGDTEVVKYSSDNFADSLFLGNRHDEFTYQGLSLLLFNLSTIPADATINSAKLQLYVRDNWNSGGGSFLTWEVKVYRVDSFWDVNTVNWFTRPNTTCCWDTVSANPPGIFYTWNIPSLVSDWVDGSRINHGLQLIAETGCLFCELVFDSSEATFKPRLVINYTQQIQTTITPASGGTLSYTDPQGNMTTVSVPPGAVTQITTLIYTPGEQITTFPPGFAFAGHAFSLDAEQNGLPVPDLPFNQPVTLTINYSDIDVAGLDENTLIIDYWDETINMWKDAATTCNPTSIYNRQPNENRLSVAICHLTDFGLFGQSLKQIYIPLVLK